MNEQKRVKLTHGTARVDKNCSKETIKILNEMSTIAYEMKSKLLNIGNVIKPVCDLCFAGTPKQTGDMFVCPKCGEAVN